MTGVVVNESTDAGSPGEASLWTRGPLQMFARRDCIGFRGGARARKAEAGSASRAMRVTAPGKCLVHVVHVVHARLPPAPRPGGARGARAAPAGPSPRRCTWCTRGSRRPLTQAVHVVHARLPPAPHPGGARGARAAPAGPSPRRCTWCTQRQGNYWGVGQEKWSHRRGGGQDSTGVDTSGGQDASGLARQPPGVPDLGAKGASRDL